MNLTVSQIPVFSLKVLLSTVHKPHQTKQVEAEIHKLTATSSQSSCTPYHPTFATTIFK